MEILYPGFKYKAVTFSYDDGVEEDIKLIRLFNTYNLKGTFNLNTGLDQQENSYLYKGKLVKRLHTKRYKEVYKNHEVATHSHTHPALADLETSKIREEISLNLNSLKELTNQEVVGHAYAFGSYNDDVISVLKEQGIIYARGVENTNLFELPQDFYLWSPTCHHNDSRIFELTNRYITLKQNKLSVCYIWGHSYEFTGDDNFDHMEEVCKLVCNHSDIWYATNKDIVIYLTDSKKVYTENNMIINPSKSDVYIKYKGVNYIVKNNSKIKVKN